MARPIASAATTEWDRNNDMRLRLTRHAVLAVSTVAMLTAGPQDRVGEPLVLSSAVAPSAVSEASVPVPLAGESAKRRHRPSWIWRVFGAALPAHGGCENGVLPAGGGKPPVTLDRLDSLFFCFHGFTPKDKPVMRIVAPDGRQTEWAGEDLFGNVWYWAWTDEEVLRVLPHPGTYRFEVTAAETPTTFGTIEARSATKPDLQFSDVLGVRPGQTVTAMVVGRRPGSPIFASLYGSQRPKRLRLVRDFPPVIADRWGEGVIRWTVTDEPDGDYGLLVEIPHNDRPDACLRLNACRPFVVER
ncbi:hypothetical protein ACTOB_005014 [Actinoplanes oblitus]|uniref:Uncharacterized protein n=1 Tax=Actinoplanes oblitus TaxID=3040509 RepID=A0ABY8W5C2_9ACTN|nr:hypothetical protein [Actinoplanes oblitus]WIM93049.1 hypothetical protein ACTOB_005014 [Actinoplanes oblitus]